MADYRTEEEQIELLKKWWHENGKEVVIAVLASLVVFFGWTTWQSHQRARNEAAADLYQQIIVASGSPALASKATELAEQLRKEYPNTVYGVFAALNLAKDAVTANDLPRAASLLEWAQAQHPDEFVQPLIGLRLAQVQYAHGDLEHALASLPNVKEGSAWQAVIAELRGDIFRSQNKPDEARSSYEVALKALEASADQEQRSNLEVKLSGLPKTVPGTTSAPGVAK